MSRINSTLYSDATAARRVYRVDYGTIANWLNCSRATFVLELAQRHVGSALSHLASDVTFD